MVSLEALVPDLAGFAESLAGTGYMVEVVDRMTGATALLVERKAKQKVHKKTAITAGSIGTHRPEPMVRVVSVQSRAGPYLEFGTPPHMIVARNASALMLPVSPGMGQQVAQMGFEVTSPFGRTTGPRGTARLSGAMRSGQIAFFRSVNHPGSQPYPFLIPAFRETLPEVEGLLAVAAREIILAEKAAVEARNAKLTGSARSIAGAARSL